MIRQELPTKLKQLNDLIRKLQDTMEIKGIKVVSLEHSTKINQFFQNNIPNIISACQGLLRGEPTEKHELRLAKDFPSVFENLEKIKELPQAKEFKETLDQIESILKPLSQIYKEI